MFRHPSHRGRGDVGLVADTVQADHEHWPDQGYQLQRVIERAGTMGNFLPASEISEEIMKPIYKHVALSALELYEDCYTGVASAKMDLALPVSVLAQLPQPYYDISGNVIPEDDMLNVIFRADNRYHENPLSGTDPYCETEFLQEHDAHQTAVRYNIFGPTQQILTKYHCKRCWAQVVADRVDGGECRECQAEMYEGPLPVVAPSSTPILRGILQSFTSQQQQ